MQREEFEKLALEHLDAVYRMAMHLTRDADEASDLVQEVYARAFRPGTIERFEDNSGRGGGGMRSWLFTITHNVFYTSLKRKARRPVAVESFFEASDTETAPHEAPPHHNGDAIDWEQVDGRLKRAIADLKPEYREVLLMWGVEGLKYREIAEIMDVPIGTVMSRLHRARKLLADALRSDEGLVSDLGLRAEADGGGQR